MGCAASRRDRSRRERDWERRERRKRERDRQRERDDAQAAREELLPPEERALLHARREAERKAEQTGELIKFGIVTTLLLIFFWPVGLFLLLFGGTKHFKRFYRMWVEPRLRERYMREEVHQRVHAHLSGERQALESVHAHSMEELSARVLDVLGRVERSVSHLLRFARDEELRMGVVRLADVADSALETFRDRLARSRIELVREIDGHGEIRGDAEKLRRVVINLVANAIDAIDGSRPDGGRVAVGVGENLAGTEVWLRVADDGPGLDAEALRKIWSPFYTSKANGTGLGLAIVKKLVEAHGGAIEAAARPGGGAEFVAVFPRRRVEEALA